MSCLINENQCLIRIYTIQINKVSATYIMHSKTCIENRDRGRHLCMTDMCVHCQ